MCIKLLIGNLNPDPYPPHPTSTYTVTLLMSIIWQIHQIHTFMSFIIIQIW